MFVADQYDFTGNPLVTPTECQDATIALYAATLGESSTASCIR